MNWMNCLYFAHTFFLFSHNHHHLSMNIYVSLMMAASKLLLMSNFLTCGLQLIQVLCGCYSNSTVSYPCNSKDLHYPFSISSYMSGY